jgi:uncharacterized membrane protein
LVHIDRSPTRATLRTFGCALALACFAHAAWGVHAGGDSRWLLVAGLTGCAVFALAFLQPDLYRRPYVLIGWLTFPVRWLVAMSVLAVLYFVVITPVALLVRRQRARQATRSSDPCWVDVNPRTNKSDYFKQF